MPQCATAMPDTEQNVTLAEALDSVLQTGVVAAGDVSVRVADIDLLYLNLKLMATSISRARELSGGRAAVPAAEPTVEEQREIRRLQAEIRRAEENIPRLIDADTPERTEKGIAKLVLTLIELVRTLLEKEAYRRVKQGALSTSETERLGLTLKAVRKKLKEAQATFGLEDEELNLDLGPLGRLM